MKEKPFKNKIPRAGIYKSLKKICIIRHFFPPTSCRGSPRTITLLWAHHFNFNQCRSPVPSCINEPFRKGLTEQLMPVAFNKWHTFHSRMWMKFCIEVSQQILARGLLYIQYNFWLKKGQWFFPSCNIKVKDISYYCFGALVICGFF